MVMRVGEAALGVQERELRRELRPDVAACPAELGERAAYS